MITGGELFDYIANTGAFTEEVCKFYFKQMLQGIHYIHSRGFSHRDLKPENILLDKNYNVKIVDFGFACPLEGRDGSGINRSQIGTPGYMAPEILAKQPYQGQVVDIFALGVILFIMRSGHPPFAQASEDDRYYQLLATNRSDLFWKAHSNSQRKGEGYYSEEFKDLITCMLQFHPHQRLCLADIVGHPWCVGGPESTAEQIREEFGRRQDVNKQRAREEEERKNALRAQNAGVRRDVQQNGKVYLSHGEEADAAQVESGLEVVNLRLKEMDTSASYTTSFFSTLTPGLLMESLVQKMTEQGQQYEMSNQTWKVSFNLQKDINEGNEAESAPQMQEQCKAQVEILKVPNQDKFCLNFSRKAGSAMLFYDFANKYMDLLELCNNTTLDE